MLKLGFLFKFPILFFPLYIFSIVISGSGFAESGEYINSYNVDISINIDGTIKVIENINYFFDKEKHGIIRDIPYTKTNIEGKKYILDFDILSVSDERGGSIPYVETKDNGILSLKIGDPNKIVSGNKTYAIEYKVKGALTYFSDHTELYWNALGDGWEVPIKNSEVKVTLPASLPDKDVTGGCYTGYYKSSDANCRFLYDSSSSSLLFTSMKSLGMSQGFTIVVGIPNGVVAVLEPKEDKLNILLYIPVIIAVVLWYVVLPLYISKLGIKEFLSSRKAKVVSAWFDVPKDSSGVELAPSETSALVDKGIDEKDITATIIHLAQRGYLKIIKKEKDKTWESDSYNLQLTAIDTLKLTDFEKYFIKSLSGVAKNNVVSVDDLQDNFPFGEKLEKFKEKTAESLIKKGLFKDNIHKRSDIIYMLIGFAFFTGNIPLIFTCIVFGLKSAKRTLLGIEKYGEAKSLRNFLVSQDAQLDFQAKNQMFFEKLLPYATAFGVEDVWVKRFSDLVFQKPSWYEGDSFSPAVYTLIGSSLSSTFHSSSSSGGSSSTGHSSGFSGGFSGGGGGGGGGGSW